MSENLVINSQIAAELFGDELVLIDVQSGRYFSLRGAAVDVWQMLGQPTPATALTDAFVAPDHDELAATVDKMLTQGLLVRVPGTAALPRVAEPHQYRPPQVEVYADLAELIALDPVHEVDAERGWPIQPPFPVDV